MDHKDDKVMADGAASYQRRSLEDTVMATADRMLYEAAFTNFYGTIEFSFKCGKLVLVRRSETIVPFSSNGQTDGGEAISEDSRDGTHQRFGQQDRG